MLVLFLVAFSVFSVASHNQRIPHGSGAVNAVTAADREKNTTFAIFSYYYCSIVFSNFKKNIINLLLLRYLWTKLNLKGICPLFGYVYLWIEIIDSDKPKFPRVH